MDMPGQTLFIPVQGIVMVMTIDALPHFTHNTTLKKIRYGNITKGRSHDQQI
jgi:hypothetical protein